MIKEAEQKGYQQISESKQLIYSYCDGPLDYILPDGFYFEEPCKIDLEKQLDATWEGFGNKSERPKSNYRPTEFGSIKGMDVVVKNEQDEYVCCASMYFIPENKLAYLEPLATIEKYRNRGIASAALSELYKRTRRLDATHMTGGYNKFYYDLGFKPVVVWTTWKK